MMRRRKENPVLTVERLHKVMARAGVASRRRSEELILRGLVTIDGLVVRELGVKVDPRRSRIEVMGKQIKPKEDKICLMLNKPRGCLTTVRDPFGRPTVMRFVSGDKPSVFPVGRLDLNSQGLLLLTNDGELAYRLTHPKHKVTKIYIVVVRGRPTNQSLWRLRQGVELEDGKTRPATVRILEKMPTQTALEVALSEGRKRQIRRMCQAVGHPVLALKRVAVGPVKLGDLPEGKIRSLTESEYAELQRVVGLI